MAEGIDAASFEFYEGIRILIPGAISLSLIEGGVRTFSADGRGLGLGTFTLFVLALLVGLVFYFADAPTKTAVFSPLQPTDILREWGLRPQGGISTINAYFVMLDTIIPAPIRARALYMGSMFRIGFEAIYLLAIGSAIVLAAPLATSDQVPNALPSWSAYTDRPHLLVALTSVLLVMAFAANRDRGERQKERRTTDITTKHSSNLDAFAVLAMIGAGALLMIFVADLPAYVPGVLILGLYLLWSYRYFRGYEIEGKGTRRPIAAGHACVLLGVANLSLLIVGPVLDPSGQRDLALVESRAWMAAMVAGLLLACARGHEKRLRGAYATQNSWLLLNKDRIIADYFVSEQPATMPAVTPTVREPQGLKKAIRAWLGI